MIELKHFQFLPESEYGLSQLEIVNSFLDVLEAESAGSHNPVALLHKPESEFVTFNDETKNKGTYVCICILSFQWWTICLQRLTFVEFTSQFFYLLNNSPFLYF